MGLEQKLSLRLSQRLVITPTLQQAIKLLQMTRLELQDVVNQELVSNPVLEEQDPENPGTPDDDSGAAETRERELAESPGESPGSGDAAPEDAEGAVDPAVPGASETPASEPVVEAPSETLRDALGDIDLEAYFGDYMDSTATAPRMSEQAEEFSLENRADAPPGLEAHLTEQLGVSDAPPGVRISIWLPSRRRSVLSVTTVCYREIQSKRCQRWDPVAQSRAKISLPMRKAAWPQGDAAADRPA